MRLVVGVWWLIPAVASVELALLKYKQPYGPKMCALLCEGSSELLCSFSETELSCKVFGKERAVVTAAANSSSELNRTLVASSAVTCAGLTVVAQSKKASQFPVQRCVLQAYKKAVIVKSSPRLTLIMFSEKVFVSRDGKINLNQHFERRTWDAALRICQSEGGSLVKINTPEKEDVIFHNLNVKKTLFGGDFVWIGLKDITDTNTFVWTDNSSLTHHSWGGGQPSNFSKGRAGEHPEDCVALAFNILLGVVWDDRSCSERSKFLCETLE